LHGAAGGKHGTTTHQRFAKGRNRVVVFFEGQCYYIAFKNTQQTQKSYNFKNKDDFMPGEAREL
jgi:hypothetical protein